ncbi:hotdog fold thioesterase [Algoriphagus pacificus]|uniref:Hotdog fold thioesterase n=1 Tax=Algoriphagus pacificus TaxID=2811234 RepID=A0ABS3CFC4_9BACT|nr:hotdog fold thioesterase [Algoriphagus pacificus]MBN7815732.1 hotdog fold thioesterase [Algoriphagus pacificus]
MVFKRKPSLEELNNQSLNTLVSHLGIIFTAISEDSISATMPVDERTKQPMGLLHGGANVVLAETLGSIASSLTIDVEKQACVGLEINANHIKAVKSGYVIGTTTPIHVGKSTQIWEIKITNEQGQLSCISRITIAIIDKK